LHAHALFFFFFLVQTRLAVMDLPGLIKVTGHSVLFVGQMTY
jgi:hypothetical protein